MRTHDLANMVKGWFVGPFDPTVCKTSQFECAVKRYAKGDQEKKHVHREAIEFTVVVDGKVRMNGQVFERNAIIEIPPGEATDFAALADTVTFVVKVPAVIGDKYEC